MASKFEMKLFPSLARIAAAVSIAFVAAVYVIGTRGSTRQEQPFQDVYSPDKFYVAGIDNGSQVNLTSPFMHGKWWRVAEGDNRIVGARWLAPRRLEIDFRPGDQNGIDDPKELPRQRTRFRDVEFVYRLVPVTVATR